MLVLLLALFTTHGYAAATTALDHACATPIKVDDRSFRIYRIAKPIVVTEILCWKNMEYYYVPDKKYYTDRKQDSSENCLKAYRTRVYYDSASKTYIYNVSTSEETRLVTLHNELWTNNSHLRFEQKSEQAYLIVDKITLKSGVSCDYEKMYCYDRTASRSLTWRLDSFDTEIPIREYAFRRFGWDITSTYFLNFSDESWLVLERGTKVLALKIAEQSSYDNKTIFYTNRKDIVISEEYIQSNKDEKVWQQVQDPVFSDKNDIFDDLEIKCRLHFLVSDNDKKEIEINRAIRRFIWTVLAVATIVVCIFTYFLKEIFCNLRKIKMSEKQHTGLVPPVEPNSIAQPTRNVYEYI